MKKESLNLMKQKLAEKVKWHKRHVTIDTPCYMKELESIIHAIGEQGGWCDAQVNVDEDRIVIVFGEEPNDTSEMQMING